MDNIILQRATADNVEAIAKLHTKSWRNSYKNILSDDYLDKHALQDRQAVWQKRFEVENLNQFVLIAKEGDSLVGFVCLFANYDQRFGSYLDNLHVDPSYQGQGLGKQLMQKVAIWLLNYSNDTSNQNAMYLWVFKANQAACRFYESLGGVNFEVSNEPMPDGNRVASIRFVWDDVSVLK